MKKLAQICCFLLLNCSLNLLYAWNSLGHRLIAEIAYENMSTKARIKCKQYNDALNQKYHTHLNFNWASVWLDWQDKGFEKHYINLPFSLDNTKLRPPNTVNAVTTIEEAKQQLNKNSLSSLDKGIYLRTLIHVVGDIHQPLHAASQYSKTFPKGDKGGNLYRLKRNRIAKNLHAYWDRGAGYLLTKKYPSTKDLKKRVKLILKRYPCNLEHMILNPANWARDSHLIAIKAYPISKRLDKTYQKKVQKISEQRIALAGCRLAALLNEI